METFYHTARWARLTWAIKNRDKQRCVRCGSRQDLHVHHIRPASRGGAVWSPANLETLCEVCHLEEHGKTSHKARQPRIFSLSEWHGFARRPDSPQIQIQPGLF